MKKLVYLMLALGLLVLPARVFAANTPTLNQTIIPGVLATDIWDATRTPVALPTAAFTNKNFAFDCYSGGQSSTATLGTNTQRLYVVNPDAADNGWTLTIAATAGATATWANTGVTQTYDFNDPTASGCTDSGDADSKGGQLTVDPSTSTITADCATCVTTNVTLGSSAAFNQGTVDSITLVNAASASNDVWRGYVTGASLSQTLPAEQPVDSYSLPMTLTVTSL